MADDKAKKGSPKVGRHAAKCEIYLDATKRQLALASPVPLRFRVSACRVCRVILCLSERPSPQVVAERHGCDPEAGLCRDRSVTIMVDELTLTLKRELSWRL
jgi:hypothetical protein